MRLIVFNEGDEKEQELYSKKEILIAAISSIGSCFLLKFQFIIKYNTTQFNNQA